MSDGRDGDVPGLVDVAVVMAREMLEADERDPEAARLRRVEAAARLLGDGFTPAEVDLLYGEGTADTAQAATGHQGGLMP